MHSGIMGGIRPLVLIIVTSMALLACGGREDPAATRAIDPEEALRSNTAALAKTVLEGAIAGAGGGGGIGFALGGREGAKRGSQAGSLVGLTAGSYVAFIQRRYLLRESRLREVLEDLEENNALLTRTLASMQAVVAKSRAELAAAKAGDAETLARETAETRANLAQMQTAIARAEARQSEFQPVRALNLSGRDGQTPDPHLQLLANRITQMKTVAEDLQSLL